MDLTQKQKRYLKSKGSTIQPVVQVGKSGITLTVAQSTEEVLKARELIKIRILRNCSQEPAEAARKLAELVQAHLVQVIGRNALLFKINPEKTVIELPQ